MGKRIFLFLFFLFSVLAIADDKRPSPPGPVDPGPYPAATASPTPNPIPTTTYFLAVTGPFGSGETYQTPLDASTQSKLDAIYAAYLNQGSDNPTHSVTLIYEPGLYQTDGWFFQTRETACSGNYHIGAGRNKTTIQLVNSSNATADGTIFATDGTHTIHNWGCSDMTLDCNAVNQPKWTGAGGKVSAIKLPAGSNITIQRVRIIGFGTATSGSECFPCSVEASNAYSNVATTNVLIDDCTFMSPAAGNKDGCSIVAIADYLTNNNTVDMTCVISNCKFINCYSPTSGQPGDFSYQHCYGGPNCVNNYSLNCEIGFYLEPNIATYTGLPVLVQGNTCINALRGVYVIYHSSSSLPVITIQGNNYNMLSTSLAAIQFYGNGSSPAATTVGVVITGNTILSQGGTSAYGVYINEGSANDLVVQGVTVSGNTLTGYASGKYIDLDARNTVIVSQSVSGNNEN